MKLESLSQEQHNLYFDVQRSIRYHERRTVHFERLQRSTNALTILTAGIALIDIGEQVKLPGWCAYAAALTALSATGDLVIGFGRMADLHRNLRRRFCLLECRMVELFPHDGDIRTFELERLAIQQDEPPVFRALDVLCHNEVLRAFGYSVADHGNHFGKLPLYMRLTAQWWPWSVDVDVPR